jgi:drug/metabolite transporter (DMT)-like permease
MNRSSPNCRRVASPSAEHDSLSGYAQLMVPKVQHSMPSQSADNRRGIVMMLIAVGAFSLMDCALKMLTPHYPALQVTALRAWCSLPVVLIWILSSGRFHALFKVRWSLHLLRGVIGITMLASFSFALRSLPLAEAYAIFFVAPLLITALAGPVLHEKVGRNRWIAIGVGMLGVLVVLRPDTQRMFSVGGLAVLASALCYAVSALTARILGRTESSANVVFWLMAMMAVGATVLTGRDWRPVQAQHAWILLGMAATGSIGQFTITEAFKRGSASLIAPFEYTALAWGIGLDYFLWQVLPQRIMLLGALIIIASGIYLMWTERTDARRATTVA